MTKVTMLKTGESATLNDAYAARLIEQGKAVLAGDEKPGVKKAAEKTTPAAEGKKK